MKSSTEIGDELRDYVIELLESDGHHVSREPRVNTKKVDVFLRLDDEYVPRTVAIECKNVASNISQHELSVIYADYLSLIESKRISEIWVIARRDFSPEGKNWADARANFHIFTLAEFEERQLGFRKYARQVKELFRENDLDRYYIQQRVASGELLSEFVTAWINADDSRPLALLGGYGMGKTSFCRYLVADLSDKYLADTMTRLPIYIRLSDIARMQDLSGLIAKTLADRYRVKDYYFEKFMRLNRAGKFVLIFDGFDEMKHALSWTEFKYNFAQINSTVQGRAKIIVAGRPNAFLSDDEHSWVLRGIRRTGEQSIRQPGWPEYIELDMQAFTEDDARQFLRRYLSNSRAITNPDCAPAENEAWIEGRLAEFGRIKRGDEMFRPVHLKIFSDIATDEKTQLRDFNVFELYNVATSRISDRESEKAERASIDSTVRQNVIEELAWWLWEKSDGRSLSFSPTEVPPSIIRRAFNGDGDHTIEAMYREIFSGSFVERKFGENYYFSHRSFLEFFIAKRLARSRQNGLSVTLMNKIVNPEILTFMSEGGLVEPFADYFLQQMIRFSGDLDFYLLKFIHAYVVAKKHTFHTSQIWSSQLFRYLNIYEGEIDTPSVERVSSLVGEDFDSNNRDRAESALYFATDLIRTNLRKAEIRLLADAVISKCVGSAKWGYRQRKMKEEASIPKLTFSRENLFEFVFLRNVRVAAERNQAGGATVLVDFERLFNDVHTLRRPHVTVTGREPATGTDSAPMRFSFDSVAAGLNAADRAAALEVLRAGVPTRIGN